MSALRGQLRRAAAAAAALTGKRFGLLVASSVVATSAIVASAIIGTGGSGALAALLARNLGAHDAPPAGAAKASTPAGEGGPAPPAAQGTPAPAAARSHSPAEAVPAPAATSEPAPAPTPAPEEAAPGAGPVKHVFVISLTSPGYEQSLGAQSQMPYLSGTLRPQGEVLSNYTLLDPGALANGIAAVGGQPPNSATSAGCPQYEEFASAKANSSGVLSGSGCVYPVEILTLADQLGLAGLSWRAYVAGMADPAGKPASCVHPEPGASSAAAQPGDYAPSQNPFVYFHSLLDLGECSANDVPVEQLSKDLGEVEKTPSYSFIAPTPCESGAAGQCSAGAVEGAAAADAFLAAWVPKILASPAYRADGLLIVTFSAVNQASAGTTPSGAELRTGALLVSPLLQPGASDAASYDPYSLLRSTEDLFGLSPLARAGGKTRSFAPSLLTESSGD